jgi:tetratricopeptide (TPR) repeat protein
MLAMALGVVFFGGCTTTRSNPPATATPMTKNRLLDESGARKEVEEARRMIEAGDYSIVIPRLLQVIAKFPDAEASLEARYWLGVAYYRVTSYREAINLFNEYLRLAPHGKFAADSSEYVAQLTSEYEEKFWTAERLDATIKECAARLQKNPDDFDCKWELAGLLWQRGDYRDAGQIYVSIVQQKPEYRNDATVRSRIDVKPSGEVVVLTPAEMERRYIEEKPLVVINQYSFQSGKDLYTRESRFYVVTGQAYNRGDSVLYGVQVIVTLYGFGNIVYDTNTVNIGRLNPGERRAFSVRFSNFENIDNINRFECTGTFQR